MRKAMSLLLAFVMVLGLCACGSSNAQPTAAPKETTESVQLEATTTAAAEETTVPETTEETTEPAYDGVLRPYLPAFTDKQYLVKLSLNADDTVDAELYDVEMYRASHVDQLQPGDKIEINGNEIDITKVEVMPADDVYYFSTTVRLNGDNNLQLLQTLDYDFNAEPDENGQIPSTPGDYMTNAYDGSNYKLVKTLKNQKLHEYNYFVNSVQDADGNFTYEDGNGNDLLALLKEHPEKFEDTNVFANIFDGKLDNVQLYDYAN